MNIFGNYKHYKGNTYEVIGEATHTETEERLIIYKTVSKPYLFWARPFEMFFGTALNDGVEVPRFTRLEE